MVDVNRRLVVVAIRSDVPQWINEPPALPRASTGLSMLNSLLSRHCVAHPKPPSPSCQLLLRCDQVGQGDPISNSEKQHSRCMTETLAPSLWDQSAMAAFLIKAINQREIWFGAEPPHHGIKFRFGSALKWTAASPTFFNQTQSPFDALFVGHMVARNAVTACHRGDCHQRITLLTCKAQPGNRVRFNL